MPGDPRSRATILAPAVLVAAASICIAADSEVEIVRVTDRMGSPTYEVRGAPGNTYRCTAMDVAGTTLATATPDRATGIVMFPQVKGDAVDRVACEEQ